MLLTGRLFGPAYHRKLGQRFDWPDQNSRPAHHNRPHYPTKTVHPHLNNDLRGLEEQPHQDPSIQALQPEKHDSSAEEGKQTTVVKESTKPVEEADEKVINVDKVEPVHQEEEGGKRSPTGICIPRRPTTSPGEDFKPTQPASECCQHG